MFKRIFILALLATDGVQSVSLVYNLKIRRSFSVHRFLHREHDALWLLSAVPVLYQRKRHLVIPAQAYDVHEKTFLGGSIFNVRCLAPKDWWVELTTGVERQTDKVRGTSNYTASRTGLDDIVLTAGKNWRWRTEGNIFDKAQFVLYGLAGFPTRWKVTPVEVDDTLVGTRFIGTGFGAEGSYTFFANIRRGFAAVLQTRFVHFFDRHWFPILPCPAKIQPGNITDLFLIFQYREQKNLFEVGYNPTFFTQQAVKAPTGTTKSPAFVRNSFYASYTHVFLHMFGKVPGTLGCGFNISRAKLFDTKIAVAWINLSVLL